MAIAACPTKESVCGLKRLYEFENEYSTASTATMATTWAATDTCTYHIKAQCGAPGFVWDSTNTGEDALAYLHYVEWDTAYPGFIESVDNKTFPQYKSSVHVIND